LRAIGLAYAAPKNASAPNPSPGNS
jgi:hypothetical protein